METAGQRYLRSLRENNNNEQPSVSTSTTKETAGQKYLRSLREERAAKVGGGRGVVNPENVQPTSTATKVIASVVSPIDAVINMVGSAPAGVARIAERVGGGLTSEQADQVQESLTPPQNILGNALGVSKLPDYRDEGARAAIETAGEFMGKGVKAVANFFNISEGDAESLIGVLTARTPPVLKATETVAGAAVNPMAAVTDAAKAAGTGVSNAAVKIPGQIADAAKAAGTGVSNAAKAAGTGVSNAAKAAGTSIADTAASVTGLDAPRSLNKVIAESGKELNSSLAKRQQSVALAEAAENLGKTTLPDGTVVENTIPLSRGQITGDTNLIVQENLLKQHEEGAPLQNLEKAQSAAIQRGLETNSTRADAAGNTVRVYVDTLNKESKEAVRAAYEKAEKSPEAAVKITTNNGISNTARVLEENIDPNSPINTYVKNVFKRNPDGSFTMKADATISDLSKLQKTLNERVREEAGNHNYLLGTIREAIKKDIENTLGTEYESSLIGQANKLFAERQKEFKSYRDENGYSRQAPFAKILEKDLSDATVLEHVINDFTPTQLKTFLETKFDKQVAGNKETAATVIQMGHQDILFNKVREAATEDGVANYATRPAYEAFKKEIDSLNVKDKNGVTKLEAIYGKDNVKRLNDLNTVYDAITRGRNAEPVGKTAIKTANLLKKLSTDNQVARKVAGAVTTGALGLSTGIVGGAAAGGIALILGRVLDGYRGKAVRKAVEKLVKNDPALKTYLKQIDKGEVVTPFPSKDTNFSAEELKNPNVKPVKQTNQPNQP